MKRWMLVLTAMASVGAMQVSAHAATITWANQTIAPVGGVLSFDALSTSGARVDAQNLGSADTYDKDTGHGTITFVGDATAASSFNRLGNSGGPYFGHPDAMLNSADWGLPSAPSTLTLSGLTDGQAYLVQLLVVDNRNSANIIGRTLSVDGGTSVLTGVYGSASQNGYVLFTGTFTADAATQSITLVGRNSSGVAVDPLVNAYQVRAVPEPGTLALVFLGSVGLVAYAWRKRK